MANLTIKKHKLPFGDYVSCALCKNEWSVYVGLNINEHEIVICPDCFEDFRRKVNGIK